MDETIATNFTFVTFAGVPSNMGYWKKEKLENYSCLCETVCYTHFEGLMEIFKIKILKIRFLEKPKIFITNQIHLKIEIFCFCRSFD